MKRVLLALIRFYKTHITVHTPPCCRFYPTCSSYAYQAITRFGAWKGSALAIRRILRCNPLFPGGVDPVPEIKPKIRRR